MARLRRDCLCEYCAGCYKTNIKDFRGKFDCPKYRPVDKRVWCADETISNFMKTGKVSR